MKILITGGAGFIGSNLTNYCAERSYEVFVYDNLSRGFIEYLPSNKILIKGDILDLDFLKKSMKDIDIVVHLAAYGSVIESIINPTVNFDNNVRGTFNVLDASRYAHVEKVVFASTGGALIGNALPPVDERSLPQPISPYGSSKLCGEAYCHSFSKSYDLHTICLRFANVYGPYSAHKKGAITQFMKCLLRDEPIQIFGDGTASRDFLHVDDLCDGIIRAINSKTSPGSVYHLASAKEVSVLDLATIISSIAGKPDHDIQFLPKRKGEVDRNFANYDKAKAEIGFEPAVDFNFGLASTWKWYLDNKDDVLNLKEYDS